MKYSLLGFSQVEICRYNAENPDYGLNGDDLVLLGTVMDFFYSAQKPKSKIKHLNIGDVTYYYIDHRALVDELPFYEWCIKTVQRRLAKYVRGGLLTQYNRRGGPNGGVDTFYAVTEKLKALKYNKDNPEHKINPASKREDTNVLPNIGVKDTSVPPASTEEQGCPVAKDTNVLPNIGEKDTSVPSDIGININNTTINMNPTHHPSVPSFQENTSDKNTETVSHVQSEDSDGRTVFYSGLSNKFGFTPRFSPDPYYDIEKYFDALNLDYAYMRDYVSWLYDYLQDKCRKKEAFPGFFAIAAVKTWNLDKWYTQFQMQMTEMKRDAEAEAERQKEYITCPVCGARHDRNDSSCPHCKTSSDMLADEQDLKVARDVWQLKQSAPDKADAYFAEITDASADMMSAEWMRMSAEDRQKARDLKIEEIRQKYYGAESA